MGRRPADQDRLGLARIRLARIRLARILLPGRVLAGIRKVAPTHRLPPFRERDGIGR